jgi:lysophospholipase L1-like esterase
MLLGDSITQSNATHYSYRYYLWKKLLDSGINFDFVGGMTNNNGGNPHWPDYLGQKFDPDHQAHWGLRADQVFDRLKHQNHRPSMALIHLGTNDEIQSQSTASTKNDLKNIVANLRNKNPKVIIFLAKIIPYRSILNPALNNSLASLVAELNTPNSPVILVDQNSGFNVNTDTFDRIHPSDSGERKMADRWYGAIMRKIN